MEHDIDEVASRDQLAELIKGLPDPEIVDLATAFGVHEVLAKIFDRMETDFSAAKGPRRESTIRWEIEAPDRTHIWDMTASRTACTIVEGSDAKPRATLKMGIAVFLRIISRTSNGTLEMAKGKVKLKGDLTVAAAIDSWFPK